MKESSHQKFGGRRRNKDGQGEAKGCMCLGEAMVHLVLHIESLMVFP